MAEGSKHVNVEHDSKKTIKTDKTVVIGVDGGEESRHALNCMDGSEHSIRALQWYAENCYRPQDKVILVYTVEMSDVLVSSQFLQTQNPQDIDAFRTIFQVELKKIHKKMEEFGEFLKEANIPGVVKSTHATKPGEGILSVAKEVNADLIVTGSRGLGKLRRTILGSVSDYVVHHSDVPVLVCRYKEK